MAVGCQLRPALAQAVLVEQSLWLPAPEAAQMAVN
jgi:hypothetical protein